MKKKLLIGGLLVAAILVATGVVVAGVSIAEASAKSHSAQRDIFYDGPDAQQSEHSSKPYIGIALRAVPEGSDTSGAIIVRVAEGSPADGSLQVGDIITTIDDESVEGPRDVIRSVRERSPGDVIAFSIARDGASVNISVTAGERPVADYKGKGGKWRGNHKFNLLGKVTESFVLSDTRYMTDDGVKTVRRAVGTAQNIDADADRLELLLRDGSETLSFTVDDDTKIATDAVEGAAGVSDLSADTTTMVVEVTQPDGARQVNLVAQGEFSVMMHRLVEGHGSDMMPRLGRHDSDNGFSLRRLFRWRGDDDDDNDGYKRRGGDHK